ncbi:transposase [Nonomuraea sp. NPDC050680]|uniref:transposase n=1 Tax=Nonomuraea sp. NPDC050680 TaxID=3154630 RepID=UPI00340200A5
MERLREVLAELPLPRWPDGRIVLAVDVSPWLRSDAPCSAERLFCHVYGRAKSASQFIPGWPYSFVAALEMGRSSWTALLDVVRLGPADDATAITAITAAQLRGVVERLIAAGQWSSGDPDMLIVTDAGYDITRPAYVLRDLPVELLGRIRSDRVLRLPAPPRLPGTNGRPPKHGGEFRVHPGRPCHLVRSSGEHRDRHHPLQQGRGARLGPASSSADTPRGLARSRRDLYADWPAKARGVVATLRMASGRHPDDPLLTALVGELTVKSPEFATMWADHRVKTGGDTAYEMRHPLVGAMRVTQQTLWTTDDQAVVVATTEPGSPSHSAMTLLVHSVLAGQASRRTRISN